MWLVHGPQALGAQAFVLTSLFSVSSTNCRPRPPRPHHHVSLSHFSLWPSLSISSSLPFPWPLQQHQDASAILVCECLRPSSGSTGPARDWWPQIQRNTQAWLLSSSCGGVIWAGTATALQKQGSFKQDEVCSESYHKEECPVHSLMLQDSRFPMIPLPFLLTFSP